MSVDWDDSFRDAWDVNVAVKCLQMFLRYLFLLYSTEKTVHMRNIDPPWLSPSLKILSDARDRALSKGHYAKSRS